MTKDKRNLLSDVLKAELEFLEKRAVTVMQQKSRAGGHSSYFRILRLV